MDKYLLCVNLLNANNQRLSAEHGNTAAGGGAAAGRIHDPEYVTNTNTVRHVSSVALSRESFHTIL